MPWNLKRLLSNKIAIAIFGAVLVASAGSAAALAASGGGLQTPFASQTPSSHNSNSQHNDGHEAEGTISSIDSGNSRFVVKTEHGASVTVVVNSATAFTDGLHSFADLKTGMSVEVDGTLQSDGTLVATKVHGGNEGSDDSSNDDHGSDNDSGASATPGADDHGGSGPSGSSTPGSGGHDDGAPHN
jgi:hypothetical protein